jgi:hypothetical protein
MTMATMITINVTNNSPTLQDFFFFQGPALYGGGQQVYSNSLYTSALLPYATSGAVLSFTMILQNYAGVQQQVSPPQIGMPSGQLSATQAINVTGSAPTANTTTMMVSPSLGLSVPVFTSGPQHGSFRIVTPAYNPVLAAYNAGSAVHTLQGGVILSNFVTAQPNINLDCQPTVKFYVQTGTYTPGTVMNITSSSINAALCDATPGYTAFNVSYNPDGTWTVQNFALARDAEGRRTLVADAHGPAALIAPVFLNAQILNESGTAVISDGSAGNLMLPMTVNNLSNPGAIRLYNEYQVGPTGGPYQGAMCMAIAGATGTFA